MIAMTLAQVASAIGVGVPDGAADVLVRSVEFDTRRVTPGALFVALRGERVDGHEYAAAAAAAGAVAVLGSAPIDADLPLLRVSANSADPANRADTAQPADPTDANVLDPADDADAADTADAANTAVLDALGALARASVTALVAEHGLQVVGVTGSSGKTSTKDLIAAVLHGAVDSPGRVVAPPRIGAVLNVGSAHLGEFGSIDAIARTKAELVQALPSAAHGGVAILNVDDPRVAAMAKLTTAEVVTVGRSPDALVRAEDVTQDDADRARFTLVTPEGSTPAALAVVGAHQIGNALAAAAVGRAVGMPVRAVAEALSGAAASSRWRMEVTELTGGVTLINDAYNANPHSMKAALRSLSVIGRGRRSWAVLGEMAELGPDTNNAHDEIGRLVVRLGIERLIVVQGPGGATGATVGGRTGARALHLGAHLEGSWGGESELVSSIDDAVGILEAELAEGDVVLVKASRSAGLERVALRLIDVIGVAGGPDPGSASPAGDQR